MQNLKWEEQLLVNTSRLEIPSQNISNIKNILQNKVDWEQLLKTAQNNGVSGLLYLHLRDFNGQIPSCVMQSLSKMSHVIGFNNLKFLQELKNVLSSLEGRGLPAILFKGAFLIEKVYNNLTLRHMGDLDILIRKDDFAVINNMLVELGFSALETEYPKESFGILRNVAYIKKDSNIRLDLH